MVATAAAGMDGTGDLADALDALAELERTITVARQRLAVAAVLDQGWSYARLGRALRITRQAAAKTYGPIVEQQLHRNARRAAAGEITVTDVTAREVLNHA
jgi:hypothetical protein